MPRSEILEKNLDSQNQSLPLMTNFCALPNLLPPNLPEGLSKKRQNLLVVNRHRWVNGTVLRYYFFDKRTDRSQVELPDGGTEWRAWTASEDEKEVVRQAFSEWKSLGIGLEFKEVKRRENAEIRIGFMQGDGSWSYLGQQALKFGTGERTMNFGWPLSASQSGLDTALHEIGHALGCPHEHQHPNSGIVWDEPIVIQAMASEPNCWDEETTRYNILRRLGADEVTAAAWDKDSVMQYPFPASFFLEPEGLRDSGINPPGGLSNKDKAWATNFYPPLTSKDYTRLAPGNSVALRSGEDQQMHFCVTPGKSKFYEFRTYGESDSVMVLFKKTASGLRYVTSSGSTGEDRDTRLQVRLDKGKEYILRIIIFYADNAKDHTVVML